MSDRPFELSFDEFIRFTSQPCAYCGSLPKAHPLSPLSTYNGAFVGNGIDRIDNDKGYVAGNMLPCCTICNHAKHKLSEAEFRAWLEQVAKFVCKKDTPGDAPGVSKVESR